ncbi:MAG: hypothetical protein ASARMPREDX12_005398 [Alectoria sarmentosa]|nr:MAG: hypothetical protein ASARMPREDX12_005398 [Alectoria sarmentosa]
MDKYEKVRSSSHSPRSPSSPGTSRFDTRPRWRQNRICYIFEGLGTLIVLRLRSLIIIALLVIITSGVLTLKPLPSRYTNINANTTWASNAASHPYKPIASPDQPLHILIPATKQDINLCKLLFTGSILGYPTPVITGWGEDLDESQRKGMTGGGSHLLKISRVLEYLGNLGTEHNDDLVLMMDGYDIWFQLHKDLLIERYYQINAKANKRIKERMGRAAKIEGIEQTIIFGAGKRCWPNEIHTVACWPLPPSPLPKDLFDGNTDNPVGSRPNPWSTTRQKFLNSGLIMGPVADMRALFARAEAIVEKLGDAPEPDDNGSKWSEKVYHNSDQSVFNMIFGEQEYQREVIRIRHISWLFNPILKLQQFFGKDLSDTDEVLEGAAIENILNPPWSHMEVDHLDGKPLEFSIGLDYWSDMTFQTANSERNGGWMSFNQSLEPQVQHFDRWDCNPHLRPLPADVTNSQPPFFNQGNDNRALSVNASWNDVPLYTQYCNGVVPVMLHHNGDKASRDNRWHKMWYYPYAETMFKAQEPRQVESLVMGKVGKELVGPGSAFNDRGGIVKFEDACQGWNFQ